MQNALRMTELTFDKGSKYEYPEEDESIRESGLYPFYIGDSFRAIHIRSFCSFGATFSHQLQFQQYLARFRILIHHFSSIYLY